jgi:GDPmannose 4,6-dehydratase
MAEPVGHWVEQGMARALIVGVSGQDGAYLARLLDARGVEVWGTTRAAATPALTALGVADAVTIRPTATTDDDIAALLDAAQPDAIYHLAGVHAADLLHGAGHPGDVVTIDGWLAALRGARAARMFVAVSASVFGDTGTTAAHEATPFDPQTRFAVASAAVARSVDAARREHGVFAAAGLMFPHESRFAPRYALAQHIIAAAHAQSLGRGAPLRLGNLDAARDCGWAAEYVDAMTRMLQVPTAADWVVATGTLMTVREIADWAYGYFKLDWRDHVIVDATLDGAGAPRYLRGDPAHAAATLGWRAHTHGRDLIETLCEGYAAAHPA